MEKKTFFFSLTLFIVSFCSAQTKDETEKNRKKDSVQLAEVKKKYPDNFRFNIVPIELTDKSLYIKGYMSGLRVFNNLIPDSIHRNYHADMPDTSTEIPYASFSVIGESIKLQFLQYGFFAAWDSKTKNSMEFINNTNGITKNFLPQKENEKFFFKRSIRISINGKPLFNWKKVGDFKRQLYKMSSYENEKQGMYGYEYAFDLCDTTLHINDQLFIEIKEDSTNQMIDSYNITRKAAAPKVSAIFPLHQKDSVIAGNNFSGTGEKKTLR